MGRVEQHEKTNVQKLYTDFMVGSTGGNKSNPVKYSTPENVQEKVNVLKRSIIDKFKDHCEKGLFTMKFILLDHIDEDVSGFD